MNVLHERPVGKTPRKTPRKTPLQILKILSDQPTLTIPEVTMEVTMEVRRLLRAMDGDNSRKELQEILKLKNADHFRKAYLLPAIDAGLVEMTLAHKPKSRFQKYRLTRKVVVLKQRNRKSQK